jgi:hypothetical protein
MRLATPQNTGNGPIRVHDRRITHGGHGETARSAVEVSWAVDGLRRPRRSVTPTKWALHAPRVWSTWRQRLPWHAGTASIACSTVPWHKTRAQEGGLQSKLRRSLQHLMGATFHRRQTRAHGRQSRRRRRRQQQSSREETAARRRQMSQRCECNSHPHGILSASSQHARRRRAEVT